MNLVSWGLWVTLMDGLVVLTWVTIRVVGEICQTLAYSLCPPHPSSLKDTHPWLGFLVLRFQPWGSGVFNSASTLFLALVPILSHTFVPQLCTLSLLRARLFQEGFLESLLCLPSSSFCFSLTFYFMLEYSWLTMVWWFQVSCSDLAIYIHVSILSQILFPSSLLRNTMQSSLCYTIGPCWLF